MAFIVSNPLTRKSIELPWIDDGAIWAMTIMAEEGHDHSGVKYKVMAVVITAQEVRIDMYDSSLKSWTTAGQLPENLRAVWTMEKNTIVVSEDFLYLKCLDTNSTRWGIVSFNIQNGTSLFTELPLEYRCDVLCICGSRVLLGSYYPQRLRLQKLQGCFWILTKGMPSFIMDVQC